VAERQVPSEEGLRSMYVVAYPTDHDDSFSVRHSYASTKHDSVAMTLSICIKLPAVSVSGGVPAIMT
jgi:hypothetical protein